MTWLPRLLRRVPPAPAPRPARGYRKLVIVLDGTLSSAMPGCETNAGLAARLLRAQAGPDVSVYYEEGLQWRDWGDALSVMTGDGINGQIRRAYGWLASQYREGDRIYLIGYSRGAYAVRSLSGVIGRVGLLKRSRATERHLREVYRLYSAPERVEAARAFAKAHCHASVEVECVAVWDTVKALGVRLPLIWMVTNRLHRFHDHALGDHVRAGFHALARDERRRAYAPVLWQTRPGWRGTLEQVWFRGTHADVGGQLGGRQASRPLSNIPFVWLIERVERAGIPLPEGWQEAYPRDARAPSIGPWAGWSKAFWNRWPRAVGRDPSESIHPSAEAHGAEPSPRAQKSCEDF
ncbi:MAG: DUF2235 domain-containing protein [Pseudomonadota bacterium]